MNINDVNIFRLSIAVAIECSLQDRPQDQDFNPQSAAQYIENVLGIVFANSGRNYTVEPLPYPVCSKIPLIITCDGVDQCLFWFYPHVDQGMLAYMLEDALYGIECENIRVPA